MRVQCMLTISNMAARRFRARQCAAIRTGGVTLALPMTCRIVGIATQSASYRHAVCGAQGEGGFAAEAMREIVIQPVRSSHTSEGWA